MSKKNIYSRDTVLVVGGILVLILSLIGHGGSYISNQLNYRIETDDRKISYIYSEESLEEVQKEYAGKKVNKVEPSFPWISTYMTLIGLALLGTGLFVRRHENKVIHVLNHLESAKRVKVNQLIDNLGYSREFIMKALSVINRQKDTLFVYDAQQDHIVDSKHFTDWHLVAQCSSCGGRVDEHLCVSIDTRSFSCPYCSGEILDTKFINHKDRIQQQFASQSSNTSAFNVVLFIALLFLFPPLGIAYATYKLIKSRV